MIFSFVSDHAKTTLFPDFVIWGNPPDLDSDDEAINMEWSFLPSLYTLAAFISEPSIQLTMALASSSIMRSTRPIVSDSLILMGELNVAPPSFEKITWTLPILPGDENQAIAK